MPGVGYAEAYTGDAQEIFCMDLKVQFYADPNSAATRDGTTVLNRANGGRWVKL
jgi:hypothetical protein